MQVESSGSIYGACLCCLVEGKHQHGGVYIEMLKSYLNLIVISDSLMNTTMCLACVNFVLEVKRFREMVLASQRQLHGAVLDNAVVESSPQDDTHTSELNIKEEMCDVTLEPTSSWQENVPDDEIDVKNVIQDRNTRNIKDEGFDMKIECIKNTKTKRIKSIEIDKIQSKRKRKKSDSESDTPISLLKDRKMRRKNYVLKKELKPTLSPSELSALRITKEENDKIRSNIILILKNSTVIPFINNFKSPFKCFYCDKCYIPFQQLKEHTEKEHVNICEMKVRKVLRKLPEYIITADISCLKCKLCEEEFKSIENLTEHLSDYHKKSYNDTDKKPSHGIIGFDLSKDVLKCHICGKDFPYFKNLLVHMNEHGSFVCYICGKKYLSERKYKTHVSKHDKVEATCKECGKTFVSKSAMGYHKRKEHIKSKIKCLKCPQTFHFEHYSQRLDHMEKVHGIKKPKFECKTCGKEFKSSGILSSHVNVTHKRHKEYKCDLCSYATFSNSHFKNHMKTHNGVKNHECQLCKKRFLKMYSLTRHLMMHMNDKRFTCPLCDSAFIQKVNLKSHLRHRHKEFDISKL